MRVTADVMPGVVSLTAGVEPVFDDAGRYVAGAANALTSDEPTLPSRGATMSCVAVEVARAGHETGSPSPTAMAICSMQLRLAAADAPSRATEIPPRLVAPRPAQWATGETAHATAHRPQGRRGSSGAREGDRLGGRDGDLEVIESGVGIEARGAAP